jgi:hypothetical protein
MDNLYVNNVLEFRYFFQGEEWVKVFTLPSQDQKFTSEQVEDCKLLTACFVARCFLKGYKSNITDVAVLKSRSVKWLKQNIYDVKFVSQWYVRVFRALAKDGVKIQDAKR